MAKCGRNQNNEGKLLTHHPSDIRVAILLCCKITCEIFIKQGCYSREGCK